MIAFAYGRAVWATLIVLCVLVPEDSGGGGKQAASSIDPKAIAVMDQMSRVYDSLRSYSGVAHLRTEVRTRAEEFTARVAIRRPNRVVVRSDGTVYGERVHTQAISDGADIYQFAVPSMPLEYYKSPGSVCEIEWRTMRAAQAHLPELPMLLHGVGPANRPLYRRLRTARVIGPVAMDGVSCDQIELIYANPEEAHTYAVGKQDHLLRRYTYDEKGPGIQLHYVETHTDVRADPDLPDSTFALPDGAREFVPTPSAGREPEDMLRGFPNDPPKPDLQMRKAASKIDPATVERIEFRFHPDEYEVTDRGVIARFMAALRQATTTLPFGNKVDWMEVHFRARGKSRPDSVGWNFRANSPLRDTFGKPFQNALDALAENQAVHVRNLARSLTRHGASAIAAIDAFGKHMTDRRKIGEVLEALQRLDGRAFAFRDRYAEADGLLLRMVNGRTILVWLHPAMENEAPALPEPLRRMLLDELAAYKARAERRARAEDAGRVLASAVSGYACSHGGHFPDASDWDGALRPCLYPGTNFDLPPAADGKPRRFVLNRALSWKTAEEMRPWPGAVLFFEREGAGESAVGSLPDLPAQPDAEFALVYASGRVEYTNGRQRERILKNAARRRPADP